jgi:hypothetical protein
MLVGKLFQNFKVKICKFLVRNGHLVRSSKKKQDSFLNIALMFGDQLLIWII